METNINSRFEISLAMAYRQYKFGIRYFCLYEKSSRLGGGGGGGGSWGRLNQLAAIIILFNAEIFHLHVMRQYQ